MFCYSKFLKEKRKGKEKIHDLADNLPTWIRRFAELLRTGRELLAAMHRPLGDVELGTAQNLQLATAGRGLRAPGVAVV